MSNEGRIQKEADRQASTITFFAWRLHAGEQDAIEEELRRRVLESDKSEATLRADIEVYVGMLHRVLGTWEASKWHGKI